MQQFSKDASDSPHVYFQTVLLFDENQLRGAIVSGSDMRGQSGVFQLRILWINFSVLNFKYQGFCFHPLRSEIWHGQIVFIIIVALKNVLFLLDYCATQTEVTQLDIAVLLDEYVRWLEVSMDDL